MRTFSSGPPLPSSTIPVVGSSWTSIGPEPIVNGLSQFTWGTAPFSGRITAIAVNASNPSIVYVGGAQGGIWKSKDGGTNWTPLGDSFQSLAIGAIAISQDGNTLYVGTGEPNHSGDSYYGSGLLESSDGGNTWSTLGASVFFGSAISGILIDSANPSNILVSTTWAICCKGLASSENPAGLGVFQSTNNGLTWNLVLSLTSENGVADLVGDPNNPNFAYAGDFSGNVWQTTNGGATWTKLLFEIMPSNQGRVAVALSGALPSVVFAAFANQTGALIGIYEYNLTSGLEITLGMPPNPPNNTPCGPAGGTQCWYDLILSVDPTNPNNIYFGGVDLYLSTNGGSTWTDLGGYTSGSEIHPDQHALSISSSYPGRIYIGNDGGLWYSTSYGSSWTNLNSGLGLTQFYSIAASPNSDSSAIGGTQDNACVQYSGTSSWNELTTGDGFWTGIESTNPSIMYCDYSHLNVQKSTDGGSTWSTATNGINLNDNSLFDAPAAQAPNDPGTLYIGGTQVYKTTTFASSWVDVSGSIGGYTISALTVSPSNSSVVYLGDSSGNVKISINGGATWTTIATENSPISSIAVNVTNYKIAYVSLATFATPTLLKTTNGGASWQTLSLTGVSSESIDVVKIEPKSGAIFLGTDSGVFYSSDAGNTWSVLGTGLPNIAVFDIAFTPSNYVLAATHGRGVWEEQPIGDVSALTFDFSVEGGGSGYSAPILSYVKNGVLTNTSLTTSPVTYTADYRSSWKVSSELPGSNSAERWHANQSVAGIAGSSQTTIFVYYNQFNVSAEYAVVDGGAPDAPTLTSTQFGLTYAPTLTSSPKTYWLDSGAAYSFTNPLYGSTSSERWATQTSSGTVSSSTVIVLNYYHEFAQVLFYTVVDGGVLSPLPTATGMQFGSPYSPTLKFAPTTYWFDSTGSITLSTIVLGQANERWTNPTPSISGTSSGTRKIDFYHQFLTAAGYSVVGSSSGVIAPTLSFHANGTLSRFALSIETHFLWADATFWSITNPLGGSNSTMRWYASGANGTLSESATIDPSFYEQFTIEIETTSPSEGTVSPQSGWANSGSTIHLNAIPLAGYRFVSWAGKGTSSYSGSDPMANVTLSSPILEVANFAAGSTTNPNSSSNPGQTTSSSHQSPYFGLLGSYYLALIAVFVVVVISVAFLLFHRRRNQTRAAF